MRTQAPAFALALALLALAEHAAESLPAPACSGRVDLALLQATTIFEGEDIGGTGAAPLKYVGRLDAASSERRLRLLVQFNVSGIPDCAIPTSAILMLNMTTGTSSLINIHQALANWTAGAGTNTDADPTTGADPGEPTWTHRVFPDIAWANPGADFVSNSSATNINSACGPRGCSRYITSTRLLRDVTLWKTGALPNYGWVLVGDESKPGTSQTYITSSLKLRVNF